MKQAPSFPKYAKDWLTGQATRLMTNEQRGAFDWLLCHAWLSDPPCSLPDDDAALAKLSEMGKRWKTEGRAVRDQFEAYPDHPSLIRNPKQFEIYTDMIELRERRSVTGSKGGSKTKANRLANDVPPNGLGDGEGDLSAFHDFHVDSAFAEFWALILKTRTPNPVHKLAAHKAFRKSVADAETFARVKAALPHYAASRRVLGGYVQDASTWLNDWQSWERPEPPTKVAIDYTLGYDRDTWMSMFPGVPYGQPKCSECGDRHRADMPACVQETVTV